MSHDYIDPSDDAKYVGNRLEQIDEELERIATALERIADLLTPFDPNARPKDLPEGATWTPQG